MQTVRCSFHPTEHAVVFCKTCDTHQAACHTCICQNGKHCGHIFTNFDDGLKSVIEQQATLIEAMQLQQQDAKAYHRKQLDLNKQLLHSVLQSVSEVDKTIDKLVDDLQQLRLALHTATLQAAQTARHKAQSAVSFDKLAKTVRKCALLMTEMRDSLDKASLDTLSDMVDQTPKLLQKCTELEALRVEVDLANVEVDTTVKSQFNDKLSQLSKEAHTLRRSCHELFVHKPVLKQPKDLLILAGGLGTTTTFAYDTTCDTWRKVASLSDERGATAATLWNEKMVVAGGCSSTSGYLNSVELYDLGANSWSSLPHMLHSRGGLALVCFDNTLFAVGGRNETNRLDSVERYNLDAKQWQFVESLNLRRSGLCCAVLRVGIVAAGGSDGSNRHKTCELFDGATQKWKYVASLRIARWYASAATLNDKAYVFGGCDEDCLYLDSVEEYDSIADKWTLLPVGLSVPRAQLAAATVNGRIYVCGGDPDGCIVERFDVSETCFRCVAPLPEAAYGAAAVSVPVSDNLFKQLFERALE